MHHKYFSFVLTLVTTNEKNYKDCIAFIKNVFKERKVSISEFKKLSNFAIDIYFSCQQVDFIFMKKRIYK